MIYPQAFQNASWTNSISLESFLMSIESNLRIVAKNYEYAVDFYRGKSPPISISTSKRVKLLQVYETPFILVKNLASGVSIDLINQINKLITLTTETVAEDYTHKLNLATAITYALGCLVFAMAALASLLTSAKLSEAVRQYGELRPREVYVQQLIVAECSRLMSYDSRNEEVILGRVLRHKKQSIVDDNVIAKMAGKRKVLVITKRGSLKIERNFRSSILIVLLYFTIGSKLLGLT